METNMQQTNSLVSGVTKTLAWKGVSRVTHVLLLKNWTEENDRADVLFTNIKSNIVKHGICAYNASNTWMQISAEGITAHFTAVDPNTEITGVAVLLNGNISVTEANEEYNELSGTEEVAFIKAIEPLQRPDWDELVLEIKFVNP